jgi:hypothetical protein
MCSQRAQDNMRHTLEKCRAQCQFTMRDAPIAWRAKNLRHLHAWDRGPQVVTTLTE